MYDWLPLVARRALPTALVFVCAELARGVSADEPRLSEAMGTLPP